MADKCMVTFTNLLSLTHTNTGLNLHCASVQAINQWPKYIHPRKVLVCCRSVFMLIWKHGNHFVSLLCYYKYTVVFSYGGFVWHKKGVGGQIKQQMEHKSICNMLKAARFTDLLIKQLIIFLIDWKMPISFPRVHADVFGWLVLSDQQSKPKDIHFTLM